MTEPQLRFKQENGSSYPSWNELPLGKLVTDNLDPVPTPREGYRRVGIYCHAKGTFQEDVPAENILDVDTMYRIHKDNLIVNITFAWEHAVAIVKPEDEGLLVSHRFPEYSFNEGQVPGFYKYLILRPYFKNQLSLASPGGAGRNRVLNKTQFKEIIVTVPCETEQQKIADFLSSVDDVIAASEKEVANLETQKKAAMKKIFSQEVRFKREDGSDFPEWEEKTLGDVCEPLQYGMNSAAGEYDGQNKYIRITDIDDSTHTYIGANIVSPVGELSEKYLVRKGDVLLARTGASSGKSYIYNEKDGKMYFAGFLIRAHVLDDYDDYFIYSQTLTSAYDKWVKLTSQRSGQPGINAEEYSSYKLNIPCLEEQRLIANFLSDFDEAIAAAKKELEFWKELKKGLLQQMFV